MLGVMWGIEKFKYELSGRKFHLITDHKALESIRSKAEFENNRINRWVEKIQEYEFTIEYRKGVELVAPDALSRLYEEDKKKIWLPVKSKNLVGMKVKEGKWKKHVVEIDNCEYWRFDSGILRKIPKVEERKNIVIDAHEKLLHRGIEAVWYEIKGKWYWPGIKETIRNVIKRCKTCIEINRKKTRRL
jgi:hypothetical protein